MALSFNPFVCVNDIDEINEFIENDTRSRKELGIESSLTLEVDTIYIGYPITEDGEMDEFYHNEDKPLTNLRDLMMEINTIIDREVKAGHNYAPHVIEDYCIEIVEVTGNVCCVDVGS